MTPWKFVWVAMALALGLVAGCADGRGARHEEGDVPDAGGDVGGGDTNITPRGPVTGFGLTSGGGTVQSDRFRAVVVVAGPSPAYELASPRFGVRVGIGAPPLAPERLAEGGTR